MNLSKLGTAQLKKAIDAGKVPAEQLEEAQKMLADRESKAAAKGQPAEKKTAPKKAATKKPAAKAEKKALAKKTAAKKEAKKTAPKKEKGEAKERFTSIDDYQTTATTVSGMVKKMLMPADGSKEAGHTYSEVNKAVEKKFGRSLHTSEFDRNFKVLVRLGILKTKKPARYQRLDS